MEKRTEKYGLTKEDAGRYVRDANMSTGGVKCLRHNVE